MHYLTQTLVAATAALLIIGCQPKTQEQTETAAPHVMAMEEGTSGAKPIKVAYVDMDSVLSNYDQYKEMTAALEARGKSATANLQAKYNKLQAGVAEFQQKLQKGHFVNEEAARQEQERLVKMEADLQKSEAQQTESYLKQQQELNEKLYRTIKKEVASMNEEWGYDIIFSNMAATNILFAQPQYDITKQVTERLNSAYAKEKADGTAKK